MIKGALLETIFGVIFVAIFSYVRLFLNVLGENFRLLLQFCRFLSSR
jgi:hypothetical protein